LAENIKRIKASTLEQVSRIIVEAAVSAGIGRVRKVRIDSTVTEANIHPPSDSSLLFDCVRVMTRIMTALRELGIRRQLQPARHGQTPDRVACEGSPRSLFNIST